MWASYTVELKGTLKTLELQIKVIESIVDRLRTSSVSGVAQTVKLEHVFSSHGIVHPCYQSVDCWEANLEDDDSAALVKKGLGSCEEEATSPREEEADERCLEERVHMCARGSASCGEGVGCTMIHVSSWIASSDVVAGPD